MTLHVGLWKHHQSKFWHYDIPPELSPDGRRSRPSIGTKNKHVAEEKRAKKEKELLAGYLGRSSNPTPEEFIEAYLDFAGTFKKEKTVDIHRRILNDFFFHKGVATIGQVTRRMVEEYLGYRRSIGRAPSTVDQDRRTLHAAFNWAMEVNMVVRNPVTGIPIVSGSQKPRRRIFSDEDLEKIFANVRGNPRHKDLWYFLLWSGMRISEVLALKWEHIGRDCIYVHDETKGDRTREVPLTEALRTILQRRVEDQLYVFGGEHPFTTRKITLRHLLRLINRLNRQALEKAIERGVKPPPPIQGSLHTFKSTFVTRALESGVPLSTVSEITGTSERILRKHYGHLRSIHLAHEAERVKFRVGFGENFGAYLAQNYENGEDTDIGISRN